MILTCIEITDKKRLEQTLNIISKRYEAVVEAAYDGIITINDQQNISMMNEAAKYIFGLEDEDMVGKPLVQLMPMSYRHKHVDYVSSFRRSVVDSRPMQSRAAVRGLRKDGSEFPIEVTISKINVEGKIEMTAVVRDVSERARLVEELSKAATEDHLTGVFNRRHFTKRLQVEMDRSKRYNRPLSIVMIDIDFFKKVNDQYGHDVGDQVLIEFSKCITDHLRSTDTLARWGGEEFMVLLPETEAKDAILWSNRMRQIIQDKPILDKGETLYITASFGLASQTEAALDMDNLLKQADLNLYQAKKAGRNCVVSKGERIAPTHD